MNNKELKPCPCCGNDLIKAQRMGTVDTYLLFRVHCTSTKCAFSAPIELNYKRAIRKWNRICELIKTGQESECNSKQTILESLINIEIDDNTMPGTVILRSKDPNGVFVIIKDVSNETIE